MKRLFEIIENTREVKDKRDIRQGITLEQFDSYPFVMESFTNKEEAFKALEKYKSAYIRLSSARGTYYVVIEYYVEENTYSDEGEWLTGGDVWKFAEFKKEDKKK